MPPARIADSAKSVEGAPPAPKTKRLRRNDVCPNKKLSTAEEVDAYLADIRRALIEAIEESGSVRLV